ncbi:hypothetical protein DSM112329_01671 [Paraconexibacter sp. AEG42_29]|uniref:Uncharacterized protein n=1 Tax=Paraconexibacter sp. AEG42_29 TaxID=2997339 RepID=A0AAU7ATB0_9ACTN
MLRRTLAVAAVVLGALCAGPAAAVAHPLLLQTAPAAELVAPRSPGAIRLQLSEPVVARGSRMEVTGPRGVKIATGPVVRSDDDKGLSVKPKRPLRSAVYRVRWTAYGDDGHLVRGDFSFGVAGKNGVPPAGAERLGGIGASGLGGEQTDQDGFVGTLARWLGIAAASFLFGAVALLVALRRRDRAPAADAAEPSTVDAAAGQLRPLLPLTFLLAAVAASESIIARIVNTADGSVDIGLLTSGATGLAESARGLVIVLAAVALVLVSRRGREKHPDAAATDDDDARPVDDGRRDRIYGVAGVALLLTYAYSGHALAGVGAFGLVAQGFHVIAAGLWLGGLLAVLAATRDGALRPLAGARAFAPLAAGGLGLAIVTGVIAAVREVDRWSLLRWSDYGRVVIVKSVLVGLVTLAGAWAAWRSRRPDSPGPAVRGLKFEAVGVLAVVALAATLAGLAQGRGRPLPAQSGVLAPGPAFATALLGTGSGKVTLTPGRKGPSRFVVSLDGAKSAPARVSVRLACACAPGKDIRADLTRSAGTTWKADVDLPAEGQWFAYLTVDKDTSASPVSLAVGLPRTDGSTPRDLLVVADLSGTGAARCRSHLLGLQLAVARINAEGGVDGGHKLQPLVIDDGGDRATSTRLTTAAFRDSSPVALAGACGDGADGAVAAATKGGIPVLAGDPGTSPTTTPGVFRVAADPFAQGYGLVQYVGLRVVPISAPGVRRVEVVAGDDAIGRRFVAGVKAQAATAGVTVEVLPAGSLAKRSTAELKALLDRERVAALLFDGPRGGGPDADALIRLGRGKYDFPPAPILVSERVLSEGFVVRAGTLGRIGVIQGASEVSTQTADAVAYSRAIRTLHVGETPTFDGIRGYVTGLALRSVVEDDQPLDAGNLERKLVSPSVFTDALLAPWSPKATGRGTLAVIVVSPQFLASGITPVAQGGQRFDGTYFPDGAWINASVTAYGPGAPVPSQNPTAPVPPQTPPAAPAAPGTP